MLAWIEAHLARSLGLALAAVFALYELSALVAAYTADAYVTADVVTLAPEVAGPIAVLAVADNQHVAAGAPVLAITPRPFEIAVQAAEAARDLAERALAMAEEGVQQAGPPVIAQQAVVADAQRVMDRLATLGRDQDVPQQRVDDAQRDLDVASARLRAAEAAVLLAERAVAVRQAEVAVAEVAVASARYALDRSRLAAPVAGRIVPFEARVGDWLAVGQATLAIITDRNWRVVANVTERHLGRLRPGQRAWVLLGSDPWALHAGTVRSIGGAVARTPGAAGVMPYIAPETDWIRLPRRFPVEIDLPGLAGAVPAFRGGNARVLVVF